MALADRRAPTRKRSTGPCMQYRSELGGSIRTMRESHDVVGRDHSAFPAVSLAEGPVRVGFGDPAEGHRDPVAPQHGHGMLDGQVTVLPAVRGGPVSDVIPRDIQAH